MMASIELTPGEKIGQWTVISRLHDRDSSGKRMWLCRCKCGREKPKVASDLRRGRDPQCRSCANTRHGYGKTGTERKPEYRVWAAMIGRCHNQNDPSYDRYGGRGILACERWRESFVNFIEDMGPRPSKHHTLERDDNDGPYSPDNCRWATRSEQQRNKRTTLFVEWRGIRKPLADWAEELQKPYDRLYARIVRLGWSTEKALGT